MRYIRFSSAAVAAATISVCAAGVPAAAGDDSSTPVPCYTAALSNAISGASAGDILSLARNCTYHLTSALPDIVQPFTIRGNGATIVRDGNATPAFRIFHVVSTGNGSFRLENLSVRGGNAAGTTSATGNGGGILVDNGAKLALVGVDVIDNTARVNGGGVAVSTGATATIRRSWVAFDNALSGGGVFSQGRLTLENSEVGRNHAQTLGGGILQDGSFAFVHASIISRNTANLGGGGISNSGGAQTTIIESKISNNTTPGLAGGGILNAGAGSRVTLEKSEVSGNVVGGPGGAGGGINNSGTTTTAVVLNGSKVIRNSANGPGSAVAGGIYNNNGSLALDHSYVRDNASTTAPGGLRTNVPITLTASAITHNIPTNCVPFPIPGCTN
ncbi:hypothetical protein ACIRQQ_09135 [Streptomyces fuscichromogenes]|uniref:hypothetical protein n=1 Tax=Streptomyces fuscichromogenes TaxID=1324013 RepID=UPI0038238A91